MERFLKVYEALDISLARKMKLTRKYSGAYTKELDYVFRKKDRLKIAEGINVDLGESLIYHEVLGEIINLGYTASHEEYLENIATSVDNPKNKIKIGKLLMKVGDEDLMKKFKNDPKRALSKDEKFDIIISRHPYDIAGQSTGRSWISCMTLPTKEKRAGDHCSYVRNDIVSGTIVAYLVRAGDNNISRPVSRVLIKPVKRNRDEKALYATSYTLYGAQSEEFKNIVKKWVYRKLNDLSGGNVEHNAALYYDGEYDQDELNVGVGVRWAEDVLSKLPKNEYVDVSISPLGKDLYVYGYFVIPQEYKIYSDSSLKKIIPFKEVNFIENRNTNVLAFETSISIPKPAYGDSIDGEGKDEQAVKEQLYKKIVSSGLYDVLKNYDDIKKSLIELFKGK